MGTLTATSTQTWTCPEGVSNVKVQAWGSGATGAESGSESNGGDGGGGGAYAENDSVAVTPGTEYTVTVDPANGGAASKFIGDSVTVKADSANGTNGGTVAASIGTIRFAGGAAGITSGSQAGGGGGGSAGSSGAGGSGGPPSGIGDDTGGVGGAAGSGSPAGAAGGAGGNEHADGNAGTAPGGGGGGAGSGLNPGGNGAHGQIILTWEDEFIVSGFVAEIEAAAPLGSTASSYLIGGFTARLALAAPPGKASSQFEGAPYVPNAPLLVATAQVGPDGRPYIELTVQGTDVLNLLSAADASFEASAGSWAGGNNEVSAVPSTDFALSGSYSLKVTMGATPGDNDWVRENGLFPLSAGQLVTGMAYVYSEIAVDMWVDMRTYNAAEEFLSNGVSPTVAIPANAWTPIIFTFTTADDVAFGTLSVGLNATVANQVFYVDQAGAFDGPTSVWTPGGLSDNEVVATIIDQYGHYVLGASPSFPLILDDEAGSVNDYFAPYGIDNTYTATLAIYETGSPIPSLRSAPATAQMGQAPDTITLYNRMGWAQDEDVTGILELWLSGIGEMIQYIDSLVVNTIVDSFQIAGWSQALDITRTPTWLLPWLGQFVGARYDPAMRDDLQRYLISNAPGWARGTPAAICAAAQPFLAHGYSATIDERDTSPYHFTVNVPQFAVYASTCLIVANEFATCADLEAAFATCADLFLIYEEITAAILAAKPAGLVAVVEYV